MISVLILTKNEELNIASCLESVSWCDDIHVFDSFSEDLTIEIALNAGAQVTQRIFDGYASQRNAALNELNFKYSWIFILDADERVPVTLSDKMKYVVEHASDQVSGFRIQRRDFFGKTWLKRAQISSLYIRLFRKGKGQFHREINEVLQVDGYVEDIDSYFIHFPFSKGIAHWLDKHNRYSSMEAQQWIFEHESRLKFSIKKAIVSGNYHERRYHQKGLFYKLPARPLFKWFYLIFWKCAFLDGMAGITYATLQSIYEYFIVLKTKELTSQKLYKI